MSKPGTKPTPNELKQKRGTYRADRHGTAGLVALPQSDEIPPPPATLRKAGSEAWQRIFINAAWVHRQTDYFIVKMLCEQLDEREQLREHLETDPENWRVRAGLRELEKQIISGLASCGLNPSDRARYGFAIVKTENKLEELLRRKREDEQERGIYRN